MRKPQCPCHGGDSGKRDHPEFRNNTFVQHSGRKFGYFEMWWTEPDDKSNVDVFIDDPDLKTKVAEITGDTTSEFYVIETTD